MINWGAIKSRYHSDENRKTERLTNGNKYEKIEYKAKPF
jgi:hypothetical protein